MNFRPPPKTALDIAGPVGLLEAVLEDPGGSAARFAVICHPHPLHGGTLDNKVVFTLARALQEQGMPTLRFNYRGVGRSAGGYDEGRGETDDALGVIAWGRQRWPAARLVLAGFSFGALVSLQAALSARVEHLISVALPVTRLAQPLSRPDCHWLLIHGDADELVDCREVLTWARRCEPPPTLRIFAGGDHFFHGRLAELKAAVAAHFHTTG